MYVPGWCGRRACAEQRACDRRMHGRGWCGRRDAQCSGRQNGCRRRSSDTCHGSTTHGSGEFRSPAAPRHRCAQLFNLFFPRVRARVPRAPALDIVLGDAAACGVFSGGVRARALGAALCDRQRAEVGRSARQVAHAARARGGVRLPRDAVQRRCVRLHACSVPRVHKGC